ncbi:MAG TPA: ABC transporter ATP-binding protein [Stellaceae bacterium]|nr:ABC transporter ATP-binding protein [Stellaceae bacterium]
MTALLAVRGLNKSFGSVVAASQIEVEIEDGEVVGIIGANGAGKTTFVNLVTGYLQPTSGTIAFEGRDITALPPRDIIAAGISRSFQVPQVFASATVFDNLLIACGIAAGGRFPLWRPLRRRELLAEADRLVERFRIGEYRDQPAQLLPQGVRKLLDIAMALVRQPRLLLLDEPTSGISVEEKFAIMDLIMGALRNERIAVMFIEHDMDIIARYAGRVLAFVDGTIVARGPPETVLADPRVRRAITGEPMPARGTAT